MIFRIAIFGPLSRAVESKTFAIQMPDDTCTCNMLRLGLISMFQGRPDIIEHLLAARFALNHEFVADDHSISSIDEIALIGAVSGG